ncbi:MAG: DUF1080 domain-containing protein [Acidobacteria bacterium]|nr:DUF1080 domain-containing protein [Acidobacteriota bacterium]
MRVPVAVSVLVDRSGHATPVSWIKLENGELQWQWQILEALVVGNHITATLNGKKVHDNAVLPAITGGARDNDELAPGPIMIQGDHSRVSFRKLVITPITTPGT